MAAGSADAPRIGAQTVAAKIVEVHREAAGVRGTALVDEGKADGIIVRLSGADEAHVIDGAAIDDADASRGLDERRINFGRNGRIAGRVVGAAGHDDRRIRHDQAASDFANDGSVLAILRCRRRLGVEHHARRQPNESGSCNENVTNKSSCEDSANAL